MYYGRAWGRDYHLRLYVFVQVPPRRFAIDGFDAAFGGFELISLGNFVPFRIFLFCNSLKEQSRVNVFLL